jgi:hypothetical protein
MAVVQQRFIITDAETTLITGAAWEIKNNGSIPVYLGATGVTVEDYGKVLFPGESWFTYTGDTIANEALYAIVQGTGVSGELRVITAT